MVLGALGKMTGEGVRFLARSLFKGFYERGVSANQALRELRETGLGYRRQEFLKDFSQGESAYAQSVKVRFVGEDKMPTEGILQSQYHQVPDKYSFLYKAQGTDLFTNEPDERYFFVHRNTLDTRRNLEDEAASVYMDKVDTYKFAVDSISIIEGYINPVWG